MSMLCDWHIIFFLYCPCQYLLSRCLRHASLSFLLYFKINYIEVEHIWHTLSGLILVGEFLTTHWGYLLHTTLSRQQWPFLGRCWFALCEDNWAAHHLEPLHVPLIFYHGTTFRNTLHSVVKHPPEMQRK